MATFWESLRNKNQKYLNLESTKTTNHAQTTHVTDKLPTSGTFFLNTHVSVIFQKQKKNLRILKIFKKLKTKKLSSL